MAYLVDHRAPARLDTMSHTRQDTDAPRVAIIGAGFSGIAAAVALRQRGIDDFVIFDKFDGLGGTWWTNRYPGAEVDLESHIYSFSYAPFDWSRNYVFWNEILDYLTGVARTWDLERRMRLTTKVEAIEWSDADSTWTVITADGERQGPFQAVISAVGFLNIPLVPPFARGETPFEGVLCHTSSWPEGVTMTGKRVAVLGTGSSAVQIVAEAVKDAESVAIYQIEPNWALPKGARAFTPEERERFSKPLAYRWERAKLYLGYDRRQILAGHARRDGRVNRARREASLQFLHDSMADRPDLIELLTPTFPFEGRRTVITDTYYPALKDPRVELVPHAMTELTATGARDAGGGEREFDIIVMATGFDATNYVGSYEVRGEGGLTLKQAWAGEPEALLGLMVPGFPNFFMMYGPNTNAVPLPVFYEAQAAFAAGLIRKLRTGGHSVVRCRPESFRRFNDWLQGPESYFTTGSGKVVAQWPVTCTGYRIATRLAQRFAVQLD